MRGFRPWVAPAVLTMTSQTKGKIMTKLGGKKEANAIDRHVGSRVRMRRMMCGMSQEKLGNALGLTFQQVQKYEKGTNRIGSSRMLQIAKALGCGTDFFYQGAPEAQLQNGVFSANSRTSNQDTLAVNDFMSSKRGVRIVRIFDALKDRPRLLDRAVGLLSEVAGLAEENA
jgi:transcriptional regulator with XRE-family HTH domain